MKNDNDAIKRENKKAMPQFVLFSVGGLVLGGVLGFTLVFLNIENFVDTLDSAGRAFAIHGAPWLLMALPIVELALCLPIYFSAKKQFAAWDGEDETTSGQVEAKLSVCLWITSMATILDFFLAAAQFSGFIEMAGNPMKASPMKFFGGLGAFLATLYVSAVFQQKLVDLTKRLNPEKKGSVYDVKFQKKWYESCDEAERAVIGRCAFKAYQAMSMSCLILWAVLGLGGMFFSWGFMPAMTVCVIWGVGQSVYAWSCLKMNRPGGKV